MAAHLEPEQLRLVLAVHEHGTTTAAAEVLHLTQSAVSKGVQRAERALGLPLFDRSGGRLRLRPQARLLLDRMRHAQRALAALGTQVDALRRGRALPLRLCATPSLLGGVVANAVATLRAQHPDARIELRMGDPVAELRRGLAELGFMFSPRVGPGVTVRTLATGVLHALLRADDPLAREAHVDVRALGARRLVGFDAERSPLGWRVARAFDAAGLSYAPFIQVPYCATVAHLVAAGVGVGVVDSFMMPDPRFRGVVTRPLVPEIPIEVCLLTASGQAPTRLGHAMAEWVQSALGAGALAGRP